MRTFDLLVPCHFGLEAVLKREIYDLGYEITKVEDGRVTFEGDEEAVCRANIFLRTAERVMIQVGRFKATTFEELFQGIKNLPWEEYIPEDGKFKEDGAAYPVRIFLLKDEVTVALDTSGDSLHKRGYRTMTSKAPLTETLAASLIMLTPWRKDRILVDPFCGSGTFPIEAAMIAANIAPGMNRDFTAEEWTNMIDRKLWYECVKEAEDMIDTTVKVDIQGYDIDGDVIKAARENAKRAGVEHMIHFQQRAVADLSHPKKYGFIITNPPYGERLEDKADLPALYTQIGQAYQRLDSWSMFLITSYTDTEKYIGRKADKNRKIYNGMLKTYFYQFLGPKPPKKRN